MALGCSGWFLMVFGDFFYVYWQFSVVLGVLGGSCGSWLFLVVPEGS